MSESGDLPRRLHEFADLLRRLRREDLNDEELANLRAIGIEVKWLTEPPEKEE